MSKYLDLVRKIFEEILGLRMKTILENLYTIRDPLYREIADHVIETGKPSVNQLVNTLIMQLELSA